MVFNKRSGSSDDFYTPSWMTNILISNVELKNKVIWECASGEYHIGEVLGTFCKDIIATDINHGFDFLTDKAFFDFDMIITNPPFSLKNQFLKRCFDYKKPFCLLLPLNALEGKVRQNMFVKSEMTLDILLPNKRVSYIGADNSPNFVSAWFCFGLRKFGNNNFQIKFVDSNLYI